MDSSASASPPRPLAAAPKTRVCYICGRMYGLHSFDIHLKQCKELWIAREALKDPRDRKKIPDDPGEKYMAAAAAAGGDGSGSPVVLDAAALEEINKKSSEAYNTESLSICAYCGRSFLPEKLLIHNKSCTPENPAKRVNKATAPASSSAPSTPADLRPRTASSTAVVSGGGGGAPSPGLPRPSRKNSSTVAAAATDSSPQKNSNNTDYDSDLADSNVVGSLGGPSGRPLHSKSNKATPFTYTTKEEGIQVLNQRIESLESMAQEMLSNICVLKDELEKLKALP